MSDNTLDSLTRLENTLNRRLVDDAVEQATEGVQFVSDAAKGQALSMIRRQLRVDDGAVRSSGGKPGAEYVREQLNSKEYAHFIKASGYRGGGTGPGASGSVPPTTGPLAAPGTPMHTLPPIDFTSPQSVDWSGRAVHRLMTGTAGPQAPGSARGGADPRFDMGLPFGLKPR